MKVRDTSRGRMYAVSSNPGCTVINGDMAVDVPAGGQSVILALDKTLIIDGDDNAKFVEVRWGTNAAIGSRPAPSWIGDVVDGIVSIVGSDKFDLNYIPAENKLYLAFAYDTTEAQIAEVENLLERVLPKDVVLEIDTFPIDFTRVEFLENNDGGTFVCIDNVYYIDEVELDISPINVSTISTVPTHLIYGGRSNSYRQAISIRELIYTVCPGDTNSNEYTSRTKCVPGERVKLKANYKKATFSINGEQKALYWMFGISKSGDIQQRMPGQHTLMKTYGAKLVWGESEISLVPALDNTGAPCMYDLVSKKPYYNAGSGDFLYPTESTTYSLRRVLPDWGQMTEHGLRRLYHVPEGYKGELIDYAEQNGFKLLVETPQPEEGYWIPVWRDREDCVELEWVETEAPPTEEELQIEEIENA